MCAPPPRGAMLVGSRPSPAINSSEKRRQPKRFHDGARGIHRLVREYRHILSCAVPLDLPQRFRNSGVNRCVVELVLFVIRKKVFQRVLKELFAFTLAEHAPDEGWRAVSDVGSHDIAVEFSTTKMPEHGIHRVDEVKARVDQSAVEIENYKIERLRIEAAVKTNHPKSITSASGECVRALDETTSAVHSLGGRWDAATPAIRSSRSSDRKRTARTAWKVFQTGAQPWCTRSSRISKRCNSFLCRLASNLQNSPPGLGEVAGH